MFQRNIKGIFRESSLGVWELMRDVGREESRTKVSGEKWKMALCRKQSLMVLGNTKTRPRWPICGDQAAKDEAGRAGKEPDRHY